MLRQLRQHIIQSLWDNYRHSSLQLKCMEEKLNQKGSTPVMLDHFAVIDLPSPNTGIPHLKELFSAIGYVEQGKDYLPEKQNDFLWMAEEESNMMSAAQVLPQVVVADFRLDELPFEIKKIIEKYAQFSPVSPIKKIQQLINQLTTNQTDIARQINLLFMQYFAGRDWPLPTVKEFTTVNEFNELLSWVLVFGRKPNHFTLSIHLMNQFDNLENFLSFIKNEVKLELNHDGGIIKGGKSAGIAQASTMGLNQTILLSDGQKELPTEFIEFVWRYPCSTLSGQKPTRWADYFTGFVAQHADHVIESLYSQT